MAGDFKFEKIPADGKDSKPFLAISQRAIEELESITAADKAQAVPFVRIWQIDADTGKPVHEFPKDSGKPASPITNQTASPPRFGLPSDGEDRFRERPPVSLERVHIKVDNPRGNITYKKLEFSFTVHRPEIIFEEDNADRDSWSSLITPGAVHVIEYGWTSSSGVKNGILNGVGVDDDGSGQTVPAKHQIRFVITNYNFRITTDNQFQFTIQAFEDGEFNMRKISLGTPPPKEEGKRGKHHVRHVKETDGYNARGQEIIKALQKQGDDLKVENGRVKFSALLDGVFANVIGEAYKSLGYTVKMFLGDFNDLVGTPVDKYKMNGPYIGDFEIPLKEIQETFSKLFTKENQQLTVYNFLKPFMNIPGYADTWDATKDAKDDGGNDKNVIPQLMMRAITNPDKRTTNIFIFDVRREFVKFTKKDYSKENIDLTRSEVRQKMKDKQIPFISFGKGNSYIQDANFDVQPDDKIKSIFMNRYLKPDRTDITSKPSINQKAGKLPPTEKTIYSSAIRGEITMLGNFALDLFGMVWLDFGVRTWNGPFNVLTREDTIEKGSFMTKLTFVAEGTDPLGTQGQDRKVSEKKAAENKKKDDTAKSKKRPRSKGGKGKHAAGSKT